VRPISTRFSRGRSTPVIRANVFLLRVGLALPLLVTRVLADHENAPMAADDLALLADPLHRGSYCHLPFPS
jgi:hypothetical protein